MTRAHVRGKSANARAARVGLTKMRVHPARRGHFVHCKMLCDKEMRRGVFVSARNTWKCVKMSPFEKKMRYRFQKARANVSRPLS
jgi:hypothetical protein